MAANHSEMIEVLLLARQALAMPGNDFVWSGWPDSAAALAELDKVIGRLQRAEHVERPKLLVLFAATGPICEVAVSSGWADAYVELGKRFDAALERLSPPTTPRRRLAKVWARLSERRERSDV